MTLMTAFLIKHFICDFPLQAFPYMYLNKGTYGHPGGFLHAFVHFCGTLIILTHVVSPYLACYLAALDFLIHYHIDYGKVRLCKAMNWGPTTSEMFWIVLGFDQLLHYLTYVLIIWLVGAKNN